MARKVMKYNPAFLDDEELISSFVVRHFELESVIKTINENVTESNQHILIVGPRGSGKTTLVRRIALEIERDESLRPLWYPLIFAEESYTVVSAGEFWLEALFHISEKTGDKRWADTYEELVNESDEKKLRERALAQLMDFADSQNRRILLIVENLNMLFDQIPDDDAWALRHTLLNEPRLMLLATATPELEQIENSGHAMFELFKIHELKPLDKTECSNMWKMITGVESPDNRIRPLEILTGGNPRLLSIISKFGEELSLKELMEELIHLVDDHTDYFKSQLDGLAPIERKVFLALAEIWKPSTAKEIARVTRIDVNKASSFLNRLVKRGYVRVDSVSRKTKWYDVTERLYNIYYLMRRRGAPANRVRFFVRFMIEFYPQDHPVKVTKMIAEEACKLSPDLCKDHYSAYEGLLNNISTHAMREKIIMSTPNDFFKSPNISISMNSILSSEMFPQEELTKEKYEEKTESQEGVSEKISSEGEFDIIAEEAKGSVSKGIELGKAGEYKQALTAFETVINKYNEREETQIIEHVTMAYFNKGFMFGKMNRLEDGILVYDELIGRYKEREEAQIVEKVAMAYVNKGNTLGRMNRPEDGILVYDELIGRYKEREEAQIVEKIAIAYFNKGNLLGEMNRPEEEISVYDELIGRYKEREEAQIVEKVAMAYFNKGNSLGRMNRPEDGILVYDELIGRYKEREEADIVEQVANAYFNRANVLGESGHDEEEEESYKKAIEYKKDFGFGWLKLILLYFEKRKDEKGAIRLSKDCMNKNPGDQVLMNEIAWLFYVHGSKFAFKYAERLAKNAVDMSPDSIQYKHTLACILAASGKCDEAILHAENYMKDAELVEKSIDDAIELFVELAAAAYTKESIELLEKSSAKKFLEPLHVALKLYIKEDVKAPAEIMEVARDVIEKIKEREEKRSKKTNSELTATNM